MSEQEAALSHYDAEGRARMVDVSAKAPTRREAEAEAFVALSPQVLAALPRNPKGNPLEVARFAGIQGGKRTSELIPMCRPLPLSFLVCDGGTDPRGRGYPGRGGNDREHRGRDGSVDGGQHRGADRV